MADTSGFGGPDTPRADRLDSWKEIAVYLGRGLRTVQRWEREEGLPARRHVHNRQSSVYAFRSELDAWRRGREQAPEPPAPVLLLLVLVRPPASATDKAAGEPRLALLPQPA